MEAITFKRFGLFLGLLISCAICADVHAAEATLTSRADDVSKLICENPGGFDQIFAPSFMAAVPDERLSAILKGIYTSAGPVTAVQPVGTLKKSSGSFTLTFKSGGVATIQLVIDPQQPHLVTGFFIKPVQHPATSFDDVITKIKALPGTKSLLSAELAGAHLKTIAALNENQPLAIGSAFKLYVLARLVGEIEEGHRHWEDVTHLTEQARSLPSGVLQSWPIGSPITVHTLASLMISQSDNTAADSLLRLLGRQNVEAILSPAGQSHPELNQPFIATAEMFKIKCDLSGKTADEYVAASVPARREMLDGPVAKMGLNGLDFPAKPTHISDIEWFASATDLGRVMQWLKAHSETGPASQARGVLSINPGLQLSSKTWKYIGYKGGSEPGVLDLTFLLQSADKPDRWFVVSATWNDPDHEVTETAFFDLVTQLIELTGKS